MNFASVKKIVIPEGEVKQIECNGVVLWKSGYKNWVKYSTEADGKTIYNGGLGYKEGYRIRSGGAEAEASAGSCTGFILVKGGDIVRWSGWDWAIQTSVNALNVSDKDFTNIGQFTTQGAHYGILNLGAWASYNLNSVIQESEGIWKWVVPPTESGVAYIRLTGETYNNGSKMIVTVNEEIS